MPRELTIPPAAEEDPAAFEILRVWGANKQQHVTIFWDVWDDPATWGIMLADLVNHVANALHKERGLDRAETIGKIQLMFDLELDNPTTSGLEGKVLNARRPHQRKRR